MCKKKNKLFILVGKSASGKSTIETAINDSGLAKKTISSTTRKARGYEVDGEHYYFLSDIVFNLYRRQGQFLETSEFYMTEDGVNKTLVRYGTNKNDVKLDEENFICVINPVGMRQLVDKLGKENCVTIYINRDDRDRVIGSIERDKGTSIQSTLEEVLRRYKRDMVDFEGIENEVDYVIDNNNLEETISKVKEIIVNEENFS